MKRRDFLTAAPAVALATAVPGAAAATTDPMVELVARWKAAVDRFCDACDAPGGEDFDSPECRYWIKQYTALADEIERTPITTVAGLAAFIDMIRYDSRGMDTPDMSWWRVDKIGKWAEARVMVGMLA